MIIFSRKLLIIANSFFFFIHRIDDIYFIASLQALKKIKEHNLSVAIFGAGWTHEHFGPNTFEDTENLFWAQLVPYLYIHVPFYDNDTFETSFCRGAGSNCYHLGQVGNANKTLNIYRRYIQLSSHLGCFDLLEPIFIYSTI